MPVSFPEIISKLVDNANIGKAVTDVGAGFALSIPALMLIGLHTGMSVVPIDRIKEIDAAIRSQVATVIEQMAEFCRIMDKNAMVEVKSSEPLTATGTLGASGDSVGMPGCPLTAYSPLNVRADRSEGDGGTMRQNVHVDRPTVYFSARQEIASLAARIEALDQLITQRLNQGTVPDPEIASRDELTVQMDRLIAHRDSADEEVQRLESLINEYDDARSLEFNFDALGRHITEILALSVVLGVVLSQVNRLIWVEGIYNLVLRKRRSELVDKELHAQAFAALDSEERQSLVSGYYRYMEGAINMIVPVLAFGYVFPAYVSKRVTSEPVNEWAFYIATWIIAALLAGTGFVTYKTYREKELESIRAAGQ